MVNAKTEGPYPGFQAIKKELPPANKSEVGFIKWLAKSIDKVVDGIKNPKPKEETTTTTTTTTSEGSRYVKLNPNDFYDLANTKNNNDKEMAIELAKEKVWILLNEVGKSIGEEAKKGKTSTIIYPKKFSMFESISDYSVKYYCIELCLKELVKYLKDNKFYVSEMKHDDYIYIDWSSRYAAQE